MINKEAEAKQAYNNKEAFKLAIDYLEFLKCNAALQKEVVDYVHSCSQKDDPLDAMIAIYELNRIMGIITVSYNQNDYWIDKIEDLINGVANN